VKRCSPFVALSFLFAAACGSPSTGTTDAGAPVADATPVDAGLPTPPCLQGGPDYEPPAPVASLAVTPAYLGSKTLDLTALPRTTSHPTVISAPMALSGKHLGVLVFSGFAVFDLDGNLTKAVPAANANWLDSHTVIGDKYGFYYSADGIYAVDEVGNPRWKQPVRTNIDEAISEVHDGVATTLLLDPEHDALYGAASDGYVYGLRGADGSLLWERQFISKVQLFGLRIYRGVGDRFTLRSAGGEPTQIATSDGRTLGRVTFDGAAGLPALFSTRSVAFTAIPLASRQVTSDACGKLLFDYANSGQTGSFSTHFGFDNDLVRSITTKGGIQLHTRIETTEGQVVRDAVTNIRTAAIGADGTIYGFEAKQTGYRLVAYDLQLNEKWSVDTPSQSGDFAPLLLDDGRLLWLDEAENQKSGAVLLHSVQTKSPGLAHTGYPVEGHDNQRTNWAHSWK
jgi:outer membrane protein assembly factor BamB